MYDMAPGYPTARRIARPGFLPAQYSEYNLRLNMIIKSHQSVKTIAPAKTEAHPHLPYSHHQANTLNGSEP